MKQFKVQRDYYGHIDRSKFRATLVSSSDGEEIYIGEFGNRMVYYPQSGNLEIYSRRRGRRASIKWKVNQISELEQP
jgi:hypothetical protein